MNSLTLIEIMLRCSYVTRWGNTLSWYFTILSLVKNVLNFAPKIWIILQQRDEIKKKSQFSWKKISTRVHFCKCRISALSMTRKIFIEIYDKRYSFSRYEQPKFAKQIFLIFQLWKYSDENFSFHKRSSGWFSKEESNVQSIKLQGF